MSISADEANRAYSDLASTCAKVGLDWVVHQVEEKRAVGQVTATKLSRAQLRASDDLWRVAIETSGSVARRPAVFVVAEDYSPQESLSILVEALLEAVVKSDDVGKAVLVNLEEFEVQSVAFAPESATGELREFPRDLVQRRSPEVDRLAELLNELKMELDDAPQSRIDF